MPQLRIISYINFIPCVFLLEKYCSTKAKSHIRNARLKREKLIELKLMGIHRKPIPPKCLLSSLLYGVSFREGSILMIRIVEQKGNTLPALCRT